MVLLRPTHFSSTTLLQSYTHSHLGAAQCNHSLLLPALWSPLDLYNWRLRAVLKVTWTVLREGRVLQIFAAGPSCFSHFQLIPHIFIQAHEFSVMFLVNAQMTHCLTKVFQISCCTLQYQHISNPFKGF